MAAAYYIATCIFTTEGIDKTLKEAEDKFYLETVGKSKKEVKRSAEELVKVNQNAFIELALAFQRASASEHGLTVCFDKIDTDILVKEGRRKIHPLAEVPDGLLIKAMRLDRKRESEIAKILEQKKKRKSSTGKSAKKANKSPKAKKK